MCDQVVVYFEAVVGLIGTKLTALGWPNPHIYWRFNSEVAILQPECTRIDERKQ
jgi:hypothetical protein